MRPRPSCRRNSGSTTARYFCRLRNVGRNLPALKGKNLRAENQRQKKGRGKTKSLFSFHGFWFILWSRQRSRTLVPSGLAVEKAIQVIARAQVEGLFSSYAIGGGIAALFYIEPVTTFDLDIFIVMPESSGPLISLSPIYSWLEAHGYRPSKEQVIIEGIAVQFIPVYNDLVKDGVFNAVEKTYGKTPTRVLRPEYLIALMLQTFRLKDKERLGRFLQETTIDYPLLDSIFLKYNLKNVFETFKGQYDGRQP